MAATLTPTQTRWLDGLATTTEPQCQSSLVRVEFDNNGDSHEEFCCLGFGTKKSMTVEERAALGFFFKTDTKIEMLNTEREYIFYPPPEFRTWLGLGPMLEADTQHWALDLGDVVIDWPEELGQLPIQGTQYLDEDERRNNMTSTTLDYDMPSASRLNDSGQFTFAQIADIFRYFGMR